MSFKNQSNETSYTKSKRIEALALAVTALSHAVDTEANRGFLPDSVDEAKNALRHAVKVLHEEMPI